MKRFLGRVVTLCCAGSLLGSASLLAQARGDWSMTGVDAEQSGWQKAESGLSRETVPGSFKFLWKIPLGQPSNGGGSFSEPLLASRLINAQGFKDIAFWSSGDTLYAVDSELGSLIWKKKFAVKISPVGCRPSSLPLVMEAPPVINFNARRTPTVPRPPDPPVAASARRLGVAAGGGGFGLKGIYVMTPDGMLHEQVLTTGGDFGPPVKFLPAENGNPFNVNILGKTIYTLTGRGCGSVPNGVWSLDMTSSSYPVSSFNMGKAKPLSLTGPSIAPDGTAYLVTGSGTSDAATGVYANSVIALGKDLKTKDWYSSASGTDNIQYISPLTFSYKEKQLVVAPGKGGSFVLLDAASLGGADHHTPLAETASFAKAGEKHGWDGFATWQDKEGTAWVFASISGGISAKDGSVKANGSTPHGGIVAFKVENTGGKLSLTPVWVSGDMTNPAPPVVANGVLIALAGGNSATHAVLHVLDATTGSELYSSKDEIPTYTHLSGVSVGDSHAFFTDHNNVLYSFGIGIEH